MSKKTKVDSCKKWILDTDPDIEQATSALNKIKKIINNDDKDPSESSLYIDAADYLELLITRSKSTKMSILDLVNKVGTEPPSVSITSDSSLYCEQDSDVKRLTGEDKRRAFSELKLKFGKKMI